MSLQSIINSKDNYTDNLLSAFDKQWESMSPQLQRDLRKLFVSGNYSNNAIQIIFQEHGFNDLTNAVASKFSKMFDFSRDVSKELGYNFIITPENRILFEQMNALNIETLLNTKAQIALDLKRFAIESQVQGSSVATIRTGFETMFDNMGRRLNTEIFTGIRNYESAIDLTSMQNAGIEKFQYVGPNDGKTRDSCASTHADPRQQTGWTAAEVEASNTPFIERGGWNCRDRWVAFVEDNIG